MLMYTFYTDFWNTLQIDFKPATQQVKINEMIWWKNKNQESI